MEKNFQDKNEIVRIASGLYEKGKTWLQIAEHLNRQGYKNTKGKPYSEGGIWTLVTVAKDPNYKGKVISSRRYYPALPATTKKQIVQAPQKEVADSKKIVIDQLRKTIVDLNGVAADTKLQLLDLLGQL